MLPFVKHFKEGESRPSMANAFGSKRKSSGDSSVEEPSAKARAFQAADGIIPEGPFEREIYTFLMRPGRASFDTERLGDILAHLSDICGDDAMCISLLTRVPWVQIVFGIEMREHYIRLLLPDCEHTRGSGDERLGDGGSIGADECEDMGDFGDERHRDGGMSVNCVSASTDLSTSMTDSFCGQGPSRLQRATRTQDLDLDLLMNHCARVWSDTWKTGYYTRTISRDLAPTIASEGQVARRSLPDSWNLPKMSLVAP